MSLNAALNAAQLSLSANSKRIAVSARNVAGANDPNYSRKFTPLVTRDGGVFATGPVRAGDARLYERYLESTSAAAREDVLLTGWARFSATVGDTSAGTSLVGRIGAFSDSLTEYANSPADDNLARAVVTGAGDLVRSLNDAAAVVNEVRSSAKAEIQSSVDRINGLLEEFGQVNNAIVRGTVAGADTTDDLDRRDMIVAQLSEEIGISVVGRANNDMVLYTDGGVTLFETVPRHVEMPADGSVGVLVDGVQVAGDKVQMPSKSGRIVGLVELHNTVAAEYGRQLDKVALGLIQAFREVDTNGDNPLAGLFTNAGSSALPADTTPVAPELSGWLASAIAVDVRVDPARGGNPARLRDGVNSTNADGSANALYNHNTENAPAFSGHLSLLLNQLDAKPTLADLGGKNPLDLAASSVSWVEGGRQAADSASRTNTAVLQLVTTSLSNARGVNVNDETALQLEIERAFAASAQLIAVVNNLFKTLFDAVR